MTLLAARALGLDVDLRVTSAHKATEETLRIMQQYEDTHGALVFIAVAGRSNGLGPVLSGNTSYPVINCPPPSDKLVQVSNPIYRSRRNRLLRVIGKINFYRRSKRPYLLNNFLYIQSTSFSRLVYIPK